MTRRRAAARAVGALLALGVAASGSSPSGASVTSAAQAPSQGCTRGDANRGARVSAADPARTVTIDGVTHRYLLAVPASYQPHRPTPLVLLFHGFGADGPSIADLTHLPSKGAARGLIVVTPDGPNHTWQLTGTGSDASFVDGLVAALSSSLCVDLHRVYVSGFSQGAAFAIFYACARPDRIAAISTVAVEFQLGCARPVPILAFHGTADPAVPYQDGGSGASLPGVKVRGTTRNMQDWARLDRCGAIPKITTVGTGVTRTAWARCGAHTAVDLYTIDGGGHSWPGADPARSPTPTTHQIDATGLMLDFFGRHHLR